MRVPAVKERLLHHEARSNRVISIPRRHVRLERIVVAGWSSLQPTPFVLSVAHHAGLDPQVETTVRVTELAHDAFLIAPQAIGIDANVWRSSCGVTPR